MRRTGPTPGDAFGGTSGGPTPGDAFGGTSGAPSECGLAHDRLEPPGRDLDRIAGGALARQGMLERFWGGFRGALEAAEGLERKAVLAALEDRLAGFAFGTGRVDRRCPACGRESLELKLSRHGPFVGCGENPSTERNTPLARLRAM